MTTDLMPLLGYDAIEFYVGNFKALFEAIEREQGRRGNL